MIRATVISTSNEGEIGRYDELWRAVVQVDEVIKSDGKVEEAEQIEVYYDQPRDRETPDWSTRRCPSYPIVEVGAQRLFYLLLADHWDGSKAYWISIGQDVRKSKAWHLDTIPDGPELSEADAESEP